MLALADRTGDTALAAKMRTYGELPYNDVFAQALVMLQCDQLYQPYEPPQEYMEQGSFSFENAAHSVSLEQFKAFHRILLETNLPETHPPTQEGVSAR